MNSNKAFDLSRAKIKEIRNIVIPFNEFGINVTYVTKFNSDLIKILGYDDRIIGYGVLEKSGDHTLCLSMNIIYETSERLDIDNDEFHLDFTPEIKLNISMACGERDQGDKHLPSKELVIESLFIPYIRVLSGRNKVKSVLSQMYIGAHNVLP